ncbi:hypothetical protein ACFPC0_22215 [Streptomyces andamanensis]|uniref:Lipoprotein n=2 Tax=Streptomyces andamanensis TaxID=1565035 RepID=A0ABV8TIB9_9ACTN
MKARLGVIAILLALTAGCGMFDGKEGGKTESMNMQEAADRADGILYDTMGHITPEVTWVHGISTDLSCSVSRRVSVTTIISAERRGNFLGVVERYWKSAGFTPRGSNNSKATPATYFMAPDDFQVRVLFSKQGQAQFEVTTPCVEKSAVAPPKQREGAPAYDGSQPPAPSEHSDFWSASTPVPGASAPR